VTVLIAIVTAGLSLAMIGAWALQRATGNAGWVDVVWTFATGAGGVVYALAPTVGYTPGPRAYLVAALVSIWSLRLGLHLAVRSARAKREDARYAYFRGQWGAAFESRLLVFLQIQALSSALLTLSVLVAARNPAPALKWTDFAGAAILTVAILGEGLADRQLARFKSYPPNRGAICDVGLWSWSRHPNYFFEWFGWLAYPAMAVDFTGRWPWGWVAVTGPAFMFFLLRFASGVPPTEGAMARSRGAAFARYQARVSAFFPWPPRAGTAANPASGDAP
jgi:steroid 5-alpha reductase family enzyme